MRKFLFVFLVSVTALVTSCTSELSPVQDQDGNLEGQKFGPEMVLGEKLENPYSLKNMQAAYESLMKTKAGDADAAGQLEANCLYVRFLPKDSTDVSFLLDSDLDLFDYPLDYDVLVNGDSYHDPSLPEDEITWQYTIVHPDFVFPESMQYEILEECYIPDEDIETKSGSLLSQGQLEILALENAGYEVDESVTKSGSSDKYPKGKVSMQTEKGGDFIPVKGVKVKCNHLVKIASTYTDQYGNYYMSTPFYSRPNYHIVYENNKDFSIFNGIVGIIPARDGYGKHAISGYDFNVGYLGDGWEFASINDAVYDYYTHCTEIGIKTPPSNLRIAQLNTSWSSAPMLKHLAGYKLASGAVAATLFINSCPGWGTFAASATTIMSIILPDVYITTAGERYDYIEGLVFHELGHASHYSIVGEKLWGQYINHIVTSWASGKGTYGDGTKNDVKQKICELGECWGYTSQSLKLGYLHTNYEWFTPAITSLYNSISNGYITKTDAFSCLTPSTMNIDSFFGNLVSKVPTNKAMLIEDEFASNQALTNQTLWTIKNATGTSMTIEYSKGGQRDTLYLYSNGTYVLNGLAGKHGNESSTIESNLGIYDELIISSRNIERFHLKDGIMLKDLSNPLCMINNWSYEYINNPVGNKNTSTYTYEIKTSDL